MKLKEGDRIIFREGNEISLWEDWYLKLCRERILGEVITVLEKSIIVAPLNRSYLPGDIRNVGGILLGKDEWSYVDSEGISGI